MSQEDFVLCSVEEHFQIGTKTPDFMGETREPIKLPLLKGNPTMPKTDVQVEAKGIVSSNYQSVHFGVTLTVKDVPLESIDDYLAMLQEISGSHMKGMRLNADNLLEQLVSKT